MLTFVKQVGADAGNSRDEGVVSIFFRAHVDVWASKTPQRTKHVLRMSCERTEINVRHVACRWRGPAFWRGRLPPNRTAACSRTLPLASDVVAFLLAVVIEHTQFRVAGTEINLFSGTPRKASRASIRHLLERSNVVLVPKFRPCYLDKHARAQQTTFALCVFPGVLDFARLFLNLYFHFVVSLRPGFLSLLLYLCVCCARLCICFLYVSVCARASLYFFFLLGVYWA